MFVFSSVALNSSTPHTRRLTFTFAGTIASLAPPVVKSLEAARRSNLYESKNSSTALSHGVSRVLTLQSTLGIFSNTRAYENNSAARMMIIIITMHVDVSARRFGLDVKSNKEVN